MAHYYFSTDAGRAVAAFTVDPEYVRESTFHGLPVVAFDEVEHAFPPEQFEMFVALGIGGVNAHRAAKVAGVEAKGYTLASFVSSKASVHPDFVLRPNTMVMEHALLHPFVQVGRDTIVWSCTRLAFRTKVGDHCWLAGPTMGESVVVGDLTFVGVNATVAPFVRIGASNVIGAGAVLLESTADGAVYPAAASKPSRVPSHRLRGFGR
jgi:UDP-3-O-[3-hydroxymyristoyl] glucosamine N-acyltransferase